MGAAADGDGIDIVIDPGQAFGTGAHHTTRLCLELLLELEPAGALADWGCGTGVLAIAAARLGWAPVLACDWEAARSRPPPRTPPVNGVPGDRGDSRVDLRREEGPWAPTVVANLVRPLLLEVAGVMTPAAGDADRLRAAARGGRRGGRGLRPPRPARDRGAATGGEWSALLLDG